MYPIAISSRREGIGQWRRAAAVPASPETDTAPERGLRGADGLIRRIQAAGLIGQHGAEPLQEESRAWLEARHARAGEAVLSTCAL